MCWKNDYCRYTNNANTSICPKTQTDDFVNKATAKLLLGRGTGVACGLNTSRWQFRRFGRASRQKRRTGLYDFFAKSRTWERIFRRQQHENRWTFGLNRKRSSRTIFHYYKYQYTCTRTGIGTKQFSVRCSGWRWCRRLACGGSINSHKKSAAQESSFAKISRDTNIFRCGRRNWLWESGRINTEYNRKRITIKRAALSRQYRLGILFIRYLWPPRTDFTMCPAENNDTLYKQITK